MNYTSKNSKLKIFFVLRLIHSGMHLYYCADGRTGTLDNAYKFDNVEDAISTRDAMAMIWRMGGTVERVELIPEQLKIIER